MKTTLPEEYPVELDKLLATVRDFLKLRKSNKLRQFIGD